VYKEERTQVTDPDRTFLSTRHRGGSCGVSTDFLVIHYGDMLAA